MVAAPLKCQQVGEKKKKKVIRNLPCKRLAVTLYQRRGGYKGPIKGMLHLAHERLGSVDLSAKQSRLETECSHSSRMISWPTNLSWTRLLFCGRLEKQYARLESKETFQQLVRSLFRFQTEQTL